jgi:hypothetical protein
VAIIEQPDTARHRAPLDAGKPLLLRWTTYTGPVVFVVLIVGFLIFRQLVLVS